MNSEGEGETEEKVAQQLQRARKYASGLLGRRAYSRRTLIERITRRGFDEETANHVADGFARVGVLDDTTFAESFVSSELARKPAGAILLETKLIAKGIDRQTARRVAKQAVEDRDLAADALELARRRIKVMPESLEQGARRRRLYSALARRGFDPDTCRIAVERALGV